MSIRWCWWYRCRGRMGISWVFVGMVVETLINVSVLVVTKAAMSTGFSRYVLIVYAYGLSTLLLLTFSFFLHRSERPQISFSILASIVLLSLFGVENLDLRISSSQAKLAGTVVSITGAFILTFYREVPIIFRSPAISGLTHQTLFSPPGNWILGGFLCFVHAILAALWYIFQVSILKKYPALMIVLPFYCFFVTILSAIVSLVAEKDPNAWKLKPDIGLVSVVYIAVCSTIFRLITMTCVRVSGPLSVSMFKPLGIVGASVMSSIIFLGDTLYLGSVTGAIVIAGGFYAFVWGKAKEEENPSGGRRKLGVSKPIKKDSYSAFIAKGSCMVVLFIFRK